MKARQQNDLATVRPTLICQVLLLACLVVSGALAPVEAATEMDQLSTPELTARYRRLIAEYRCPKCQNQNLADSDSPISDDLRREIRRLLEEGRDDQQISEYLVARYGDFILYRPRLQQSTYLLWLAPGLLLSMGLLIAGLVIKRQRSGLLSAGGADTDQQATDKQTVDQSDVGAGDTTGLDSNEQQRLDDLLAKVRDDALAEPDTDAGIEKDGEATEEIR